MPYSQQTTCCRAQSTSPSLYYYWGTLHTYMVRTISQHLLRVGTNVLRLCQTRYRRGKRVSQQVRHAAHTCCNTYSILPAVLLCISLVGLIPIVFSLKIRGFSPYLLYVQVVCRQTWASLKRGRVNGDKLNTSYYMGFSSPCVRGQHTSRFAHILIVRCVIILCLRYTPVPQLPRCLAARSQMSRIPILHTITGT